MKTPVIITAIHVDSFKTADMAMGVCKVSVEIDGRWVEILHERFDCDGFHLSHIIEGLGIKSRAA